jgi:hypothetical protein
VWDVDEKMVCPSVMVLCKVDEKEKYIPKKEGMGWDGMGMKKNSYAQKGWDAKGMKRKRYIPKKDGIEQGRTNGMIYKDGMRWG